jgi:hypothetical protein
MMQCWGLVFRFDITVVALRVRVLCSDMGNGGDGALEGIGTRKYEIDGLDVKQVVSSEYNEAVTMIADPRIFNS